MYFINNSMKQCTNGRAQILYYLNALVPLNFEIILVISVQLRNGIILP